MLSCHSPLVRRCQPFAICQHPGVASRCKHSMDATKSHLYPLDFGESFLVDVSLDSHCLVLELYSCLMEVGCNSAAPASANR